MSTLLLATTNPGKLREFREIFAELPFHLTTLDEEGIDMDVEETGATFAENAVLKARAYAEASGLLTLADDSGLEIDALGGEPGVHSARWPTYDTPYPERLTLVLERLANVPPEQRTARYRCVIALAQPDGWHELVEGTLEGVVADAPRGANGFGYDPIFYVPALGSTTAELSPEEKHRISHRGRAARAARDVLLRLNAGSAHR
ncbi:MAG TPA: RdgB/HAM1 family non-canonical purine NTP pyrophosphatase [Ktedonobacterales bacterium]|nr:RdgB/HAM1 family non-canonical purine NTP pyrophosphatase [Ktedonobacterales bacterium]